MTFKKGEVSNPNGRPKGALDHKTRARNALIEFMVDEGIPGALECLRELKTENKVEYLKRLDPWMEYVLEKLARVEHVGEGGGPLFPKEVQRDRLLELLLKEKGKV